MGLGEIAHRRGKNNEAERLYRKALLFFEKAQDPAGQGNVWRGLGDLASGAGRDEEAEDLYRKALSFFEKAQDALGQGNAWEGIAQVRVRQGRPAEALALYNQALTLYRKQEHRFNEMWTTYRKGKALEGMGRLDEAIGAYEKACDLADYLVERAGADEEQRVRFKEGVFEIYEATVRLRLKRMKEGADLKREEVEAFKVVERARGQVLLERLRELGIDLGAKVLPEGMRREEAARLQHIKELRRLLAEGSATQEQRRELARLEEEQRRFEDALWDTPKYMAYAAVRYPRPVDPANLALGPEEVLVEFFVGGGELYRFIVYRGKVEWFDRLEPRVEDLRHEVEELRRDLLKPISSRSFESFDVQRAHRLYRVLLEDAMALMPEGGRLVIVPDGFLWALPFEVLVRSVGSEQPFFVGLEVAIVYAPSARSREWMRRQGSTVMVPEKDLLAVGDPVYRLDRDNRCDPRVGATYPEPRGTRLEELRQECRRLAAGKGGPKGDRLRAGLEAVVTRAGVVERLYETRREVQEVASCFARERSDILLDLEASKARVMALLRGGTYRVLHFSTHGLLPDDRVCGEGGRGAPRLPERASADACGDGWSDTGTNVARHGSLREPGFRAGGEPVSVSDGGGGGSEGRGGDGDGPGVPVCRGAHRGHEPVVGSGRVQCNLDDGLL